MRYINKYFLLNNEVLYVTHIKKVIEDNRNNIDINLAYAFYMTNFWTTFSDPTVYFNKCHIIQTIYL